MEGDKEILGYPCFRATDESSDSDVDDFGTSLMLMRGISIKKLELVAEFHEVSEFYLVCLNRIGNGQLLKPCCDPLTNVTDIESILALKSHIYISALQVIPKNPINYIDNHCLTGLSFIDLRRDQTEPPLWKLAFSPVGVDNLALFCTTLKDKIYCLPSEDLCKAQFYDPLLCTWSYLNYLPPDNISKCLVSGKLIPDPARNRILVHLSEGDLAKPSLYAWYPQGRRDCDGPTWDFITLLSTRCWRKKPVLVGDVLFLYFRKTTQLFQAFDLKRKRLLDIEWDQYYPATLAKAKAISMSHTGETQLTLATYSRFISDIDNTYTVSSIYFIRYHFKRVSEDTIVFSYDLTKHFKLLNIKQVTDFICLGNE